MTTINFEEKEKELQDQFNNEQAQAVQIEEQIKALQVQHQEKVVNMTRIQGAFALLKDLKESNPDKSD